MRLRCRTRCLLILLLLGFSACTPTVPKEALELTQESLALRQLQTRRFETADEKKILASGAAVLQDLGFTIEASSSELGVIVGAKELSAINPGEVTASIVLGLATAAFGAPVIIPWDEKQKVRVSLVSRRSETNAENMLVRTTFQRIVWNSYKSISKTELLKDEKLYQEFFEKLSKALFLEDHPL